MGSLNGTYPLKLDDKSRVTLPAKIRSAFEGELLFLVCDQNRCLSIATREAFDKRWERQESAPTTSEYARGFKRWLHARTEETHMDGQGRVTLGAVQRQWAGLDRDVVVAGAGDRLEIWNPAAFDDYMAEQDERFANMDTGEMPW